jgi:molybdopterin converting factor subunit 1
VQTIGAVQIKVLFFAVLRELAGCSECELALPQSVSAASVLTLLEQQYPALRGGLDQVRVAVNETFVHLEHAVVAGDTIALIPPVAGG